MIYRVYHNARRSTLLTNLLVATDSDQVRRYCMGENIPVMLTGTHASGTDRLHEVMERTDADIYVNVQADEPTVRPEHLELLLKPFQQGEAQVTTLKVRIDAESASNPDVVKVVTDLAGRALYFSRWPIPCDRDGTGDIVHYKHIGLYAYTRASLTLFHDLPQSELELAEKLEQLRYLENCVPIQVVETSYDTIGVDTEQDLQRVIALFASGQND